jgi:uncharacterized protein with HEPN domain
VSRDWRLFLADVLRACEKILRFTDGLDRAQFFADDRTYDAVVRNLEILGEAAKHLPDEVCRQMPQIEWRKVAGMRDWLAHAYFGIDPDILWDVVENKVKAMKQCVHTFQSQAGPSPSSEPPSDQTA